MRKNVLSFTSFSQQLLERYSSIQFVTFKIPEFVQNFLLGRIYCTFTDNTVEEDNFKSANISADCEDSDSKAPM